MNAYTKNARAAYVKKDLENLSREEVVVKLYEALRIRLQAAIEEINDGNIARKAEHLSRGLAIVLELQASLDMEQGGEIAVNLNSLYNYLVSDLVTANLKNDTQKIVEALKVVEPLLEAWTEIARGKKSEARPEGENVEYVASSSQPDLTAINY
ncbi:MAG: flagellar export chaperone FliS [Desulfurivibrionaceae bacterium]|jgi:flagellar protein FliS|nr:flagellar export chaperone FliS [Pseudomonadota bacterium]MBU4408274.1 flagellar export chaperone FliS [Pseudomonadota bacterium]